MVSKEYIDAVNEVLEPACPLCCKDETALSDLAQKIQIYDEKLGQPPVLKLFVIGPPRTRKDCEHQSTKRTLHIKLSRIESQPERKPVSTTFLRHR